MSAIILIASSACLVGPELINVQDKQISNCKCRIRHARFVPCYARNKPIIRIIFMPLNIHSKHFTLCSLLELNSRPMVVCLQSSAQYWCTSVTSQHSQCISSITSASSIKTTTNFSAIIIINYVTSHIKHKVNENKVKNVENILSVFLNLITSEHFGSNWIKLGNKMTDHPIIWTSKTANSKIDSAFYPGPRSSIFYDCLKPIDQDQNYRILARVGL